MIFDALKILQPSRAHLQLVKHQLIDESFVNIISQPYTSNCSDAISINSRVQSYFWAARTIKGCHCLPRSIALYQHLKAMGLDVVHKFGVNNKDENLAAHAWVEYQGEPLNESADLKKTFTVLEKPNNESIASLK